MDIEKEIDRLQTWLLTQPHGVASVVKAADALEVSVKDIRQIAATGYWLSLEMRKGVECVSIDGE